MISLIAVKTSHIAAITKAVPEGQTLSLSKCGTAVQFSALDLLSLRHENECLCKDLCINVYNSFIHNGPKLKTVQWKKAT